MARMIKLPPVNINRDLLDEVRAGRDLPSPHDMKSIRNAAGVSQSRLAEALGVNRTTIARWEAGVMRPRGRRRATYARLLADLRSEVEA